MTLSSLRQAIRSLRRRPGLSIPALLLLALAIGGNVAVFSLAFATLIRPLPFIEPERLVQVWESDRARARVEVSPATFGAWRRQTSVFSEVACAYGDGRGVVVTGPGEPVWLPAVSVSPHWFALLGIRPESGRVFLPDEPSAVMVSHRLWNERFGGASPGDDPAIELDGRSFQIVGVVPAGTWFPEEADVWRPLVVADQVGPRERGTRYLRVVGRLAPSRSVNEAREALKVLAEDLARQWPETHGESGITVVPLGESLVESVRPAIRALLVAVLLLVLLGSFNVANLLLARSVARREELATRVAIGATRSQIFGLESAEGLLLGLAGGLLGCGVAVALVALAEHWISLPTGRVLVIHGPVLLYALGVSLAVGLVAGSAAALRNVWSDSVRSVQSGARFAPGTTRARRTLIAVEVGLAVALLALSGTVSRSFFTLVRSDPGFQMDRLLAADLLLPQRTRGPERFIALRRVTGQLVERAAALPGVRSAAFATAAPYRSNPVRFHVRRSEAEPETRRLLVYNSVSPSYREVLGLPLVAGRFFEPTDREDSELVAVLNRRAAEVLAGGGREVLGQSISLELEPGKTRRVVGIVEDAETQGPGRDREPVLFVPFSQAPLHFGTVLLRATEAGGAPDWNREVRSSFEKVDPLVKVYRLRTVSEARAETIGGPRLASFLLGGLAGLAVLLSMIGVASIVALAVRERRHELSIRMALGAEPRAVLRRLLQETAFDVSLGVAGGAAVAWFLNRLATRSLVTTVETPIWVVVAAVGLAFSAALFAAYLPARGVLRLDPSEVMRSPHR
jgi:predicted permease